MASLYGMMRNVTIVHYRDGQWSAHWHNSRFAQTVPGMLARYVAGKRDAHYPVPAVTVASIGVYGVWMGDRAWRNGVFVYSNACLPCD